MLSSVNSFSTASRIIWKYDAMFVLWIELCFTNFLQIHLSKRMWIFFIVVVGCLVFVWKIKYGLNYSAFSNHCHIERLNVFCIFYKYISPPFVFYYDEPVRANTWCSYRYIYTSWLSFRYHLCRVNDNGLAEVRKLFSLPSSKFCRALLQCRDCYGFEIFLQRGELPHGV